VPRIADLDVSPLCLGGNVFGWTADEDASFAVLDAFATAYPGTAFVDTADVYSAWADGHRGGESELVLGRWLASRGNRDEVVVATKVGMKEGLTTLDAATIRTALTASLERLGVDQIDLYYAHDDDQDTPLEETVAAFGSLVAEGLVRHVAASNHSAPRLAQALGHAEDQGVAGYVAVQNALSLVSVDRHGDDLTALLEDRGVASVPYGALAGGFLTGKYRPDGDEVDSPRAGRASRHLGSEQGRAVLAALDAAAADHGVAPAAVAVAWAAAQDAVVAPIASARTPQQLAPLVAGAGLVLDDDQLAALTAASRLPGAG
jgi:aryl-alcohol dehydrogenase-like predicted oxidoreductase